MSASRKVLVVQHAPWEQPGMLGVALTARGIPWNSRFLLRSTDREIAPSIGSLAALAILGGPMGARDFDRYPGLEAEADLVRVAADAGIPIFGVCLGHQIIANALGAQLHSGAASEFGMGTVDVVSDGVLGAAGTVQPVLHWHTDVVDAPPGAHILASTPQTPNQAFQIGESIFGTQFHLEVDEALLQHWLTVPAMMADAPAGIDLMTRFRALSPAIQAAADIAFDAFTEAVSKRL